MDLKTTALSIGAAVVGVSFALRQSRNLEPRKVPLLGLSAAFVFVAQMLNFPVLGGTSGHVLGGVLAAILLGPSAAVIVMTCVLLIQAFMFADGGLLALGANIFNMAIVSTCGGYIIFRSVLKLWKGSRERGIILASIFAGWCGTVLASIACAGELALSGTVSWGVVFPAMANIHLFIGIGEGVVTGCVVLAILKARPELVVSAGSDDLPASVLWKYALLIAAGFCVFITPFASPLPDGLESVALKLGFEHRAIVATPAFEIPWVGSPATATVLAGILGAVLAFAFAWILARVLVPRWDVTAKDASNTN